MKLITAKALTKRFRNREVVRGINLEIKQGEILALIGPNGAGKTTTILILIGILMPDAGSVAYWREDYRAHIGVQLQSTPFFEGCTAEENLRLFAAMYRVKLSKTQLHEKLEACNLTEAGKTPAIRLSTGQQKRLAIAVATMHQPDLIVLDEPTAGLDPRARHEIRQLIASLNQSGTAIVFTSHDMEEVSKIAHRVVMINNGQALAEGTPNKLWQDFRVPNLDELYLKLTVKEEL